MDFAERVITTTLALDPLAALPRTGWRLRGIVPCESIAEHSFGVAVVAMLLVDELRERGEALDGERVLRMALVHDAGEVATGDVPLPGKSPALREQLREAEARFVERALPPAPRGDWHALEDGSLEARVVKAADKVQMMIKVLAYERQRGAMLEDFWRNPKNFDDRGVAAAREVFAAIAARAGRTLPSE
ncbi:MAG: HD family hydrolase [Myxococcales bacterium]|nr:HD family hydrolase [Myxococcales bacterium]